MSEIIVEKFVGVDVSKNTLDISSVRLKAEQIQLISANR